MIRKLRNRGDISHETLDYFSVNNPKLGRFYLLPKINKLLHDVPGRPVISNFGFCAENISSFIKCHLKPLAQNVKSYIKDTNTHIFEHSLLFYKQLRDTAVGTKMAPPMLSFSWVILKKDFLVIVTFRLYFGERYIDGIFMLWQHGEKDLKKFLQILNSYHPTIKFTANYSREKISFLDVEEVIKK